MPQKKAVLIILDGVGDRANPELDNETPLQFAKTPNIRRIAKISTTGLMDSIAPGIRAGSDTSHLNLLGYDPYKVYTGRGPFEAAGTDMDLQPGDIAFRCNFATVDNTLTVLDRRAGRIKKGTHLLAQALDGMEIDDVKFFVRAGVEHRAVLVMRGPGLSPDISDVDPHEVGNRVRTAISLSPDAKKTANLLNKFVQRSYEILSAHPVNAEREKNGLKLANILLPRGAGMVPHLDKFSEKYGMQAACVVGITLIRGICKLAGIKPIDVPGATGGYDTDMLAKMRAVLKALNDYDFILVNIKAPDIAGHDRNPDKKVEVIERFDKAMGYLFDNLPENVAVVLTADHSTPCTVGDHSGDPVPIMIYASDVRRDEGNFDEVTAARGAIRIRGENLMDVIMNVTNRAEKFGA